MGICESDNKNISLIQTSSNYPYSPSFFNIPNSPYFLNKGISYIECIYDIKDINTETQIINNKGEVFINEEIESKIKILNGNQREKLTFRKKYSHFHNRRKIK